MKKLSLILALLVFILGGFFFYDQSKFNDGKLHVIFCNVGQGDATFIRTSKGTDILIDGGPDDSVLNCLTNHMPFWDRTIEVVFVTHPHADHLNGVISTLKRYNVIHYVRQKGEISSDLAKVEKAILADKKLSAKLFSKGDSLKIKDGVGFLTLWPENSSLILNEKNLDVNGSSLIELLLYGKFKILITGDATSSVQDQMVTEAGKISILRVSHHGSKTGLDNKIVEELDPDLAIISVGLKNRYGHPSLQALDILNRHGIKTLRTDLVGEIEIVSDGDKWELR
ncbi:MBL fold metallo-hydrolase [Patescibacteria group bacterium]|nr:MBL fold metallo-hydrolase [Patescibacteria group bacterium]